MENRIKYLIIKKTIRDIQIALLKEKEKGMIINEEIINEILAEIEARENLEVEAKMETIREANEEAEIDEGGEEEDEEKINDAIDTEDLGARADMEWSKEKDEIIS